MIQDFNGKLQNQPNFSENIPHILPQYLTFCLQNKLQYRRTPLSLTMSESKPEDNTISQQQYARILKLIHQKTRPLQQSQNRKLLLPKLNDQTLLGEKKEQAESLYRSIQLVNQSKQYQNKTQIEKEFMCRARAKFSTHKHKSEVKRFKSEGKILNKGKKQTLHSKKSYHKFQSLQNFQTENDDYLNKNKPKSQNIIYAEKLQRIIMAGHQKPKKLVRKIKSINSEQQFQSINNSILLKTSQLKEKKGHLSSAFFQKQKEKIDSFLIFFKNRKMPSIQKQNQPILPVKKSMNNRVSTQKKFEISRASTLYLTEDDSQENQVIAAKYRLKANHRHLIQYQRYS